MKRSDPEAKRNGMLARRCAAMVIAITSFVSLAFPNYGILPRAGAADEDTLLTLTERENDTGLLASLDFDGGAADDISGNGVTATIIDDDYIIRTEDNGNRYLDLTAPDTYLSLPGGILTGLTEMTVEMRVLTKDEDTNWAFFAAPDGNAPTVNNEHYLGILLNDSMTVERYSNSGLRPTNPAAGWTADTWYTIRVVFDTGSTSLTITDDAGTQIAAASETSTYSLADCLGIKQPDDTYSYSDTVLWFGHASWGVNGEGFRGYIDDINIWSSASVYDDNSLIVSLDFEGERDAALADRSSNGYTASLVNGDLDPDLFKTENGISYLDLSNRNAYLSLINEDGSGVLNGLKEMTLEMRVQTKDNNANWAFFAAPDGNAPRQGFEHYLGILLNNGTTVERYANSGVRPADKPAAGWTADEWHTIKVVFKISSTILCVDNEVVEIGTPYSLSKCIGENGVLWLGHAPWGRFGEYFNGCIDYIRIWNHAVYDPIDEKKYTVTERVTDPKYTTVNMFDYWITGQNDNDYATLDPADDRAALFQGINKDHLLLFVGDTLFSGGSKAQATAPEIGFWNRSRGFEGDGGAELLNTITQGIVQNTLGEDGYPKLALNTLAADWVIPSNEILKTLWNDNKKTESLAYLFDPETEAIGKTVYDEKYQAGKASYSDVTGLFRINNDGYYEFRSWETFAELNADQENAAKTSTENNRITLYDTVWGWGLSGEHDGQFFPFNDWSNMFFEDPSTGALVQAHKNDIENKIEGGSVQTTTDEPLNHYFGMTVETEFQQPVDGTLNRGAANEAMKFDFSGDDDIWIFIDGVLVGDLGGIHGWKNISIDFSTGEIIISDDREAKHYTHEKTLYEMFEAAEKEQSVGWKTITDKDNKTHTIFSDNSVHILNFFYLERGNQYSNCNITFNLQEPIVDRIRKVDRDGDPLAGAAFELYEAEKSDIFDDSKLWHNADEFERIDGAPMTVTESGDDGYAMLVKENGEALSYAADKYYILEETKTPDGYRKAPPIVLTYHDKTHTLTVVNKYEAGAYASFLAEWSSLNDVFFAEYSNKTFSPGSKIDDDEVLENGLAVVVPVIDPNTFPQPMYGSNTLGWNTVTPNSNSEADFIKALAEAAFRQIADTDPKTQHWYLRWDGSQLKGHMENLPGDATRYVFNCGNDGDLVTLFLPKEALDDIPGVGGTYANDDERYAALSAALAGMDEKGLVDLAAKLSDLKIIYTKTGFEKNNRTVIYVPNDQGELRVRKLDEDNKPMAGAVFALFDTRANAAKGNSIRSEGVLASGTTGKDGELIFSAKSEEDKGHINWYPDGTADPTEYWLKEITAPTGYELNESLIRVEVGGTGIYANATGYDADGEPLTGYDGVQVEASLGGLTRTLVKYAEGIVDETLKYITVTEQTADSIDVWSNGTSEDLIYGADGYAPEKTFTAEDGCIRAMPRQTGGIDNTAKRDELDGIDLDGLFRLVNTVVVTDQPITDSLTVTKTVEVPEGETIDTDEKFNFTVTLNDTAFNNIYSFEGGKTVVFKDGEAKFTLCHGERVTFTELPEGIGYTVTENDAEGYTMTSTGENGTIAADKNAKAEFINTKIIDDPDSTPSEPDSTPSDPDNTSSDPNDTSSEPGDTSSDPDDTSSEPDDTSSEPGGTSSESGGTSNAPNNTSSAPNNTSSAPNGTSSEPNSTPSAPNNTSSEPNSTPSEPDNTSNVPGNSQGSDTSGVSDAAGEKVTANPDTGFDARSFFRVTALTLSLIVAVCPQRKRGNNKK